MNREPDASSIERGRTLVIQTAFIGDAVLTIPLLQLLAARHGPVDVVTTPAAASLVEAHPAVRRVIPYDKRGADRGWRGFRRMVRSLRDNQYGRVYLAHRSWRSAALAWLARIPERIGFADAPGAPSYTRRIPTPQGVHAIDRYDALAESGERRVPEPWLALPERDRQAASTWLLARGIEGPFIAIAPGSIWGTKRWPYFPELAARLTLPVVAIGGAQDQELGADVAQRAAARGANAAGALTLRESAAVVERATVLVTNDSAPLHLASAVGTPIVAIFGPTVPAFGFGPIRPGDRVVEHPNLPCRPCSQHGPKVCPLGHHRCMKDVTVDQVLSALTEVQNTGEARRAVHRRN